MMDKRVLTQASDVEDSKQTQNVADQIQSGKSCKSRKEKGSRITTTLMKSDPKSFRIDRSVAKSVHHYPSEISLLFY
jgi:hypothetical protein